MSTNDSFIDVSQNMFNPEIVRKLSEETGQTISRTQDELNDLIPSITTELIEKGSTFDGASQMVEMVDKNDIEMDVLGIAKEREKSQIYKLVTPIFFDAIRKKIKTDNLGIPGLMEYFRQQKFIASGESVDTSEYYQLTGHQPFENFREIGSKRVAVGLIAFTTLILIVMWFWWNGVIIDSSSKFQFFGN